jgi:transposase
MDVVAQVVLRSGGKRHYRTAEERRRIVEETLTLGVSVATIARAHGVNANQVFHWRKLYHAGLLVSKVVSPPGEVGARSMRMLPVTIADDSPVALQDSAPASVQNVAIHAHGDRASSNSIELTLHKAQVRITGHVDGDALRVVMECLLG